MLYNVHVGCLVGTMLVNHLMYADDLVLLSPSTAGLSILLSICSTYGIEYDVMYNSTKSNVLVFRTENVKIALFKSYCTTIYTTNLAACVCVSSKFDQFLPVRFYFVSKRPENFVRIAKFPYAAFGLLFAFHCPLFVTKNNNLGWNRHASPHTGTCRCNDHGLTVLSARGQYTLAMTC